MVIPITYRIDSIMEKIEKAKERAGREKDRITIIAVTKNRSPKEIEPLLDYGLKDLGENRVQELLEKYSSLKKRDIGWHMVGHLQRNKVKYLVEMKNCVMIQSLDSIRLARKLEEELEKKNRFMEALIQVNIASEAQKYGLKEAQLPSFFQEIDSYRYLKIKGFMGILPYAKNPEEIRPFFQGLYRLFLEWKERGTPTFQLEYLSMGMTNDYEIAIEEGANMIRLGSALFEPLLDERGLRG